MRKKKITAILSAILCALVCAVNFTACESPKVRNNILKELREIPCSGEYTLVAESGYTTKTEVVYFHEFVAEQIEKDGVDKREEPLQGISTSYYDGYALFVVSYDRKYENSEWFQKYAVGYIRLEDFSTRIFYTGITSEECKYLSVYRANENYFVYTNPTKSACCVIDRETDTLIENVKDLTPYATKNPAPVYVENGVEYKISHGEENQLRRIKDGQEEVFLEVTLEYILQRSEEMRRVEKILEQTPSGNRASAYKWMICNNELFVIRESETTLFGRGVVYPLAFKYTIETDSFEYIGCSELHDLTAIIKG